MKVPQHMHNDDYWTFVETQGQADEVGNALDALRARVVAGEPLPEDVALLLLDAVAEDRKDHQQGTSRRVWGPGDTYDVCVGCGEQVMEVYDLTTRTSHPGVCRHLKGTDFLLRKSLGLGLPSRHNPTEVRS